MPRRRQGKTQHFTMQGKPIDFDALRTKNEKTIKLPTQEYIFSLQSFLNSRLKSEFENYKIFDYRIKDQLILN